MGSTFTRRETIFVAVVVVYLLGHLVFRPDLFPFSTMPMFSDRAESVSWLEVEGPNGAINPAALNLQNDYVANPNPKYGLRTPGPNPDGAPADAADVIARVESRFDELDVDWVIVTQRTVELQDDGSVETSITESWRFDR